MRTSVSQIPQPAIFRLLFFDTRIGIVWLLLRIYIGWQWLSAGYEKLVNPLWIGSKSGTAIHGFFISALKKSAGIHPDVSSWYAYFLHTFALQHTIFFSYLVTFGEIAVGIGLILGIFTGIASFFGAFMNFNYLFAGTISINPLLLVGEIFLMLAWRTAGWLGVDRFLLPLLPVSSNVVKRKLK